MSFPSPVVFFETSVFIAGCINKIIKDTKVQHRRYIESNKLISLSRDMTILGITSITVENQTKNTLEKAINDTLIECVGKRDKRTEKIWDDFSVLLDSTERDLIKNFEKIDRLAVDEKTKGEKIKEVAEMFYKLDKKLKPSRAPRAWALSSSLKGLAKEINRIQQEQYEKEREKLEEKPIIPDIIDIEILADAITLKDVRFKREKFFLASLDRTFCGYSKPWSDIREEIWKKFKIAGATPKEIMKSLK